MKPQVTFPDPEDTILDYLRASWSPIAAAFKPDTYSNSFPDDTLSGDETHVQVELDGTPSTADYPSVERCTIRVTCWAAPEKSSNAKAVATRSQAYVYGHPGDAEVFSTLLLTGRLKGTDRDSGNHFVSFTARVNMRPTAL